MENVIVFIFLAIGTVWDIKKRTVPEKYLLVWGIVSLFYLCVISLIYENNELFIRAFWGVFPGIICLFLAYVSREQIGYGDGWVLVLAGALLGLERILAIALVALSLVTCLSVVLLAMRKAGRKTVIPFLPFLLLANIIISICGRVL